MLTRPITVLLGGLLLLPVQAQAQLAIVYGSRGQDGGAFLQQVAQELSGYVQQITGEPVPVLADDHYTGQAHQFTRVMLIGDGTDNSTSATLHAQGMADASAALPSSSEGFCVLSAQSKDKQYLLFCGRGRRAYYYAIYQYLQRICHVGFFVDGEHVPQTGAVPMEGVFIADEPKFPVRANYAKADPMWLLKKGFNRSSNIGYLLLEDRSVVQAAFPEVDLGVAPAAMGEAPVNETGLALHVLFGPLNWERGWPKLAQAFEASQAFGPLLQKERERLSERDYNSPRNAFYELFHDRMYAHVIKHYFGRGVGHAYWLAYAVEDNSLRDYDAIAITKAYRAIKKADPLALVFYDAWHPYTQKYTREMFDAWDAQVPGEVGISDSAAWGGGCFGRYDSFNGRDWLVDIIYILGPTNQLQLLPNLGYYRNLFRLAAEDEDFLGTFVRPEWQMTNPMLEDWLAELSWNPHRHDVDGFLKDYVIRRYGAANVTNMLASLTEAVHSMSYGKPAEWDCSIGSYFHPMIYPGMLHLFGADAVRRASLGADMLERGLDLALAQRQQLGNSPLYDHYLDELFRSYCLRIYMLSLRRLSEAYYRELFQDGGAAARATFDNEAAKLLRLCDLMAEGLSADPRLSLYRNNPGGVEQAFLDGYWGTHFYPEVVQLKCKAIAQATVDHLRRKLEAGDRSLPTTDDMGGVWGEATKAACERAIAQCAEYREPPRWPSVSDTIARVLGEMRHNEFSVQAYRDYFDAPRHNGWMVFTHAGRQPDWEIGAAEPIYAQIAELGDTVGKFDFGVGLLVREDFQRVTRTTQYNGEQGFGWRDIEGLDGWDSGYPDDLYGDFVYGLEAHTFSVDLANGDYHIVVYARNTGMEIGDQRHGPILAAPSNLIVSADGEQKASVSCQYEWASLGWADYERKLTAQDQYKEARFRVSVNDGQLSLTFANATAVPWAVAGLVICPAR
jgi:hypothetical protein